MPKIDMSISHRLPIEEALLRIKKLLSELKEKHKGAFDELREQWQGTAGTFSAVVKGQSISGTLELSGHEARISCELPAAAFFFKGKIERLIRDRAVAILAAPAPRMQRSTQPQRSRSSLDPAEKEIRYPQGEFGGPFYSEEVAQRAWHQLYRKIHDGVHLTPDEQKWYKEYNDYTYRRFIRNASWIVGFAVFFIGLCWLLVFIGERSS